MQQQIPAFVNDLQASLLAGWIRGTVGSLPIIESIHVMAVAIVFGTILVVDLRLLGFPGTRRPFTRVSGELLGWTWGAFVVAAITGSLMFIVNAATYYINFDFRMKLVLMALAGANMAVFHGGTLRSVAEWDKGRPVPAAGRLAGGLSLALWVIVIFLGRGIGYTKDYDFAQQKDADIQLDFLQQ